MSSNRRSGVVHVVAGENTPPQNIVQTRTTRREALRAGGGFLLALALQRAVPAESAPAHASPGADLFVFEAPASKNMVIAILRPVTTTPSQSVFDARIHAGEHSWAVRGPRPEGAGAIWEHSNLRTFSGEVFGRGANSRNRFDSVVVETPHGTTRAGEPVQVWAEIFAPDGARVRVGNPFVAELLARNPRSSELYHAATPGQDSALFSDALAERIARLARASGSVVDPTAHGRRLAAFLLPDAIAYRPDLPVGFTFASQNGRHPSDDVGAVVDTILAGSVRHRTIFPTFALTGAFPYFQRPMPPA